MWNKLTFIKVALFLLILSASTLFATTEDLTLSTRGVQSSPAANAAADVWSTLPDALKLRMMHDATSGENKTINRLTYNALLTTDKNTRRIAQDESFNYMIPVSNQEIWNMYPYWYSQHFVAHAFFQNSPDPFLDVEGLKNALNPLKNILYAYFPLIKNNPKFYLPGAFPGDIRHMRSRLAQLRSNLIHHMERKFVPTKGRETLYTLERKEGIDAVMELYNLTRDWEDDPRQTFEGVLKRDDKLVQRNALKTYYCIVG